MKYLFFDIECSDGYHICSFGYALVDDKMKIVEKDDIIINPESRFVLAPKKSRPKIQLAYSDEFFYKHGNFTTQYDEIKRILTRKGQILFGHSIASDFRFLIYACKRYNLLPFELEGYDTQLIYKLANKKSTVQSLEKIVDELNIEKEFQYHKSSDDAHATFLIAKRLCKFEEVDLKRLCEKYQPCLVQTADFDKKQIKEGFVDQVKRVREKYREQRKRGIIAFSEVFNKIKKDDRVKVVEEILKNGYDFTTKIKEASHFVKNEEDSPRNRYAQELKHQGKKIKFISFDEFKKLIKREDL